MQPKYLILCGLWAIALGVASPISAAPVGTAFTFQGQLKQTDQPVNDSCGFAFELWDHETAGNQIGLTQSINAVSVSKGLFVANIDFGASAFNGEARWLEVAVSCSNGPAGLTKLAPRARLTPTPYAVTAMSIADAAVTPSSIDAINAPSNGMTLTFEGGNFRWVAASADLWQQSGSNIQSHAARVGIGTSVPSKKLDINIAASPGPSDGVAVTASGSIPGAFFLFDDVTLRGVLGLSQVAGNFSPDAAPGDVVLRASVDQKLLLRTGNTGTSDITIAGDKVGIATSNPATVLDVAGMVLVHHDQGGSIELGGIGASPNPVSGGTPYIDMHFGNGLAEDYNVRLINAGDNWLNISTVDYPSGLNVRDGKVGIGTADPTAALHVGGVPGMDGIRFPDGTLQKTAVTGTTVNGIAGNVTIQGTGGITVSTSGNTITITNLLTTCLVSGGTEISQGYTCYDAKNVGLFSCGTISSFSYHRVKCTTSGVQDLGWTNDLCSEPVAPCAP